ncbi:MAG: NmrA family NAD(P)-binding protein [Anaerolineales bacterium]|nr:NmrA family NAD(P)-binding protein [Anaerolineales bacterium]
MILVTGGTGFIGQALIRHLVEAGHQVRTLIRPSRKSPRLPRGVSVEVAVAGLRDERSLRAAMVGVDTIYHLAGVERSGAEADLLDIDVRGTQTVLSAALDAGVDRFFYLSHLGADRASAYPIFKAKAIAEEHIRRSGIDYTIMRTAIVFGPNDGFTISLAQLLSSFPFVFFIPGDGDTVIQPLWVEDLVTCLAWALEEENTRSQVYELGGPEYLSLREIIETMMNKIATKRTLVSMPPPYMRALTVFLEYVLPASPVSVYWIDYLATNRTCPLDTIPRVFNLMPSRFSHRLAYLEGQDWRLHLLRTVFRRRV